jgi:bifunctional non-homologous end joining protein LigD
VPRGPSLDPAEKRLAVHVEDHPLDYADFEGVIPAGNYGAGAVIVWDKGVWIPVEDPDAGLERGKLLFDLRGYKLGGRWTLVRTRRPRQTEPGREWLLIKKPDAHADPAGERPPSEQSVMSGLTVEELGEAPERARRLREEVAQLGAPARRVDPKRVAPMLCRPIDAPFSDPGWLFELKYDGYRLLAAAEGGEPLLRYRKGSDVTALFPEVAAAVASLPYASLLVDGEVVVFEDGGHTSFQRLQLRTMLSRARDIARAAVEHPASLVVFDLLAFEGHDLRGLPLSERKRLLREVLPAAGLLRYADHVEGRGEELYDKVVEMGLEGIVAKRADSTYRGERSDHWRKLRVDHVDDFAVVGYTAPRGSRAGLGALLLALRDVGRWTYAGRVGTGFDHAMLNDLHRRLDALPRWTPPFASPVSGDKATWVHPTLVAQVRYREWTRDGAVRMPVFLGLRADKEPEQCERPSPPSGDDPPPPPQVVDEPSRREVPLTNTDKVFWPEEGYTKGDLIDYYRRMAPHILPYLRDRPVVLTRFPDGIDGKSFYQKDAPEWVPDWIRTMTLWSEHSQRDIHYFVCDDADSLAYLANLGTIPLHVWSSRVDTLAYPDWCILDLDPKGAPFAHVRRCAVAIRRLCEEIELPTYVKTSGSTGLHVLIPLGARYTYEQSRTLGGLLARIVEHELPDIATTTRTVGARGGKVYLDYLQNAHGQLLVAPYSVRPLPGAPVSMPLAWREVNAKLRMSAYDLRSAPRRVARWKGDPLVGVLDDQPDLARALELLEARVRAG